MRYLLDTHVLIWIVTEDQKLSKKAKRIYLDNSNEIYLSVASVGNGDQDQFKEIDFGG